MPTDEELTRYGFTAGRAERWCACCGRTFSGGPKAFKCRVCAEYQADEVDRICISAGYGEAA